MRGVDVKDEDVFRSGIVEYHYNNTKDFLDLDLEDTRVNGAPRKISTGQIDIFDEWLSSHELVTDPGNTRMLIDS